MELDPEIHAKITRLCQTGDAFLNGGDTDAALDVFEEALALLPKPAEDWEAATWIFAALADVHFEKGQFESVRTAAARGLGCPGGLGNPFLHLRLGQALFELGDTDRASDELARAYMGAGDEIFDGEDAKYLQFIRQVLRPPASEVDD